VWLKKLIEIICHVYWLGEGVAYLLQKALDAVYQAHGIHEGKVERWPAFSDVKQWLEDYKARGREGQWMDSTKRALGVLCYGEIGKVLNIGEPVPMQRLLKENVVFELDALTNSDKVMFIESLQCKQGRGGRLLRSWPAGERRPRRIRRNSGDRSVNRAA